jgi:Tfp pilus assembly protein PilN
VVRYYQFSALDKKWKGMEPKRKILDDFNKEYAVYSQDEKLIKQFIEKRIDWSQKLNRLSLDLPSGIWFTDISGNPKELYIRGSVVSVERLEMSLIKKFIEALKADASFFKDFTSVDLGQLENKTVAGYDITEFNLKGVLRAK